jgi:hypothetical protein
MNGEQRPIFVMRHINIPRIFQEKMKHGFFWQTYCCVTSALFMTVTYGNALYIKDIVCLSVGVNAII